MKLLMSTCKRGCSTEAFGGHSLISIPQHEQCFPKARHQRTKNLIYYFCLNSHIAPSSILNWCYPS